jgi:hypothetical protein
MCSIMPRRSAVGSDAYPVVSKHGLSRSWRLYGAWQLLHLIIKVPGVIQVHAQVDGSALFVIDHLGEGKSVLCRI